MKQRWKVFFFLCLALFLLFGFTACSTMKETINLEEAFYPVLKTRPDNSSLEVYATSDLWSIIHNMNVYLHGWEMWQNYAESLEQAIGAVQTQLSE